MGGHLSLSTLATVGEPFLVAAGGALASVADDGSLLYVADDPDSTMEIVWVDRQGGVLVVIGDSQPAIRSPSLSPGGERVVFEVADDLSRPAIWVYDLETGAPTRVTAGRSAGGGLRWEPGANRIVYQSNIGDATLLARSTDGGDDEPVVLGVGRSGTFSSDGRYMAFVRDAASTTALGGDLWYLDRQSDAGPQPLITGPANTTQPALSPSGELLAYVLDDGENREVVLTRFPSGEGRWQVLSLGFGIAAWASDDSRLYVLSGNGLYEVAVTTSPDVQVGAPRLLFNATAMGLLSDRGYDVDDTGDRFLFIREQPGTRGRRPVLVENWALEFASER